MDARPQSPSRTSGDDLVDPRRLPGTPLVDVRQTAEYRSGHIPGAIHIELGSLASATGLPTGPLTVTCGHAERGMTGASILERAGHGGLAVVEGGTDGWGAVTGNRLVAET